MVYPPYAAPFPDARCSDVTLGTQHRAALTLLAQRPGRVVTAEALARRLNVPKLTPRRAGVLIGGINEALGGEAVTEVPRRGWALTAYDAPPPGET